MKIGPRIELYREDGFQEGRPVTCITYSRTINGKVFEFTYLTGDRRGTEVGAWKENSGEPLHIISF